MLGFWAAVAKPASRGHSKHHTAMSRQMCRIYGQSIGLEMGCVWMAVQAERRRRPLPHCGESLIAWGVEQRTGFALDLSLAGEQLIVLGSRAEKMPTSVPFR